MSDLLQPGLHLDADTLNAFAEGVLPAHERSPALAHLAECAHCREIVFLTQQAAPQPGAAPVSFWRRYRHSITLFGTALGLPALACLLILFVTLRPHPRNLPTESARMQPPASPAPTPALPSTTPKPPPPASALKGTGTAESSRSSALKGTGFSPYEKTKGSSGALAPEGTAKPLPPLVAAAPPRPTVAGRSFMGMGMGMSPGTVSGIGRSAKLGSSAPVRSMAMSSSSGDAAPQAAFAASGQPLAAVPRPTAAATLDSGSPMRSAALAPMPPAASATSADSIAAIPSAAQTVTVQNADQALATDSVQLSSTLPAAAPAARAAKQRSLAPTSPAGLPSKLPAAASVSSGPRTLAADTAGALFLSLDAGRHWQPVPAAWPGKVVQLRLAPAPALFQLLTTTGAVWLGTDGLHWQPQ